MRVGILEGVQIRSQILDLSGPAKVSEHFRPSFGRCEMIVGPRFYSLSKRGHTHGRCCGIVVNFLVGRRYFGGNI